MNALHPRTPDERDIRVGGLIKNRPDISGIKDFYLSGGFEVPPQENDECSAYAMCGPSELQEGVMFDRAYHFALSKSQDNDVDSFGTDLQNAASVSKNIGDLPRSLRPIHLDNAPLVELRRLEKWGVDFFKHCTPYKKKSYVWVDTFEEAIYLMDYYTKQGKKCAVAFGTYFDRPVTDVHWEGKWTKEENGHAMYMRGLITEKGKKWAIVQNSYGVIAGRSGCHLFDKERIDASLSVFGGLLFIDYTPEELRAMLAGEKKLDVSWLTNMLNSLKRSLMRFLTVPQGRVPTLYEVGYSLIGKHLTLDWSIPKEVGCGQAMSYVLKKYGASIPQKGISGTAGMNEWLKKHANEIENPAPGCVIVSITGTGNGSRRGHVGVLGYRSIMSNSSKTGLWQCDFTLEKWLEYYKIKGGLITKYYII